MGGLSTFSPGNFSSLISLNHGERLTHHVRLAEVDRFLEAGTLSSFFLSGISSGLEQCERGRGAECLTFSSFPGPCGAAAAGAINDLSRDSSVPLCGNGAESVDCF